MLIGIEDRFSAPLVGFYGAGPSKSEIGQLGEVAIDRSITVILTIVCNTSLKTIAIAMAASVVRKRENRHGGRES